MGAAVIPHSWRHPKRDLTEILRLATPCHCFVKISKIVAALKFLMVSDVKGEKTKRLFVRNVSSLCNVQH